MAKLKIWNPWNIVPSDFWSDDIDWNATYTEVDLYEEDDNIVAKLKAPGFEEKDIDITVEGGVLSITGNIKEEEVEKDKKRKYYRKEFRTQSFTRKIDLPVQVESEKAKAEFENGVLTVTLPKAAEAKAKKITVKSKSK